jgi:hypothetical protein
MVWGYQFSCVGRMYFALQRTGSLLHIICMLHLHTTWYNLIQELIQLDTTHVRTCSRSQRRSPECHLSKRSSHLRFPRIKLCATSCHNQFAAVPSSSQIPKIPCSSEVCWKAFNVPCLLHTDWLRLHHAPCCAMHPPMRLGSSVALMIFRRQVILRLALRERIGR